MIGGKELKPYIKATYHWLLVLAVLIVLAWLGHLTNWQLPALFSFR